MNEQVSKRTERRKNSKRDFLRIREEVLPLRHEKKPCDPNPVF